MGYMGRILRVDLKKNKITAEKLDQTLLRNFIGGRGVGTKILFDELKKGADPLSPRNKLIFASGPLTGTIVPTSGRYCVIFKSPLTGTIADSHSGGKFGPFLKFTGHDAIIIEGESVEPTYLHVKNETAELLSAEDIWGKTVFKTTKLLLDKHGKKSSIACIGPAGENGVLFANIMNEKYRAAGRCGAGAVMGSKKLKAIVLQGDKRPPAIKNKELRDKVKLGVRLLKENPITGEGLPNYGTAVLVHIINFHRIYPVRNWQRSHWNYNKAEATSGEKLHNEMLIGKKACWNCPIGCGRHVKIKKGRYAGTASEGLEFETIWAFGAECDNDNLNSIMKAHDLCDKLGIDTVTMGATLGCAMELYEKGCLNEKETGTKLHWGNHEAIIELIKQTGYCKGFGKDLSLGSKRLAEKYGAPDYAIHVKGLELPAYDARGAQGQGLGYATSNRGGCHLKAYMITHEVLGRPWELMDRFSTKDKAIWVKDLQDLNAVIDSLVLCHFSNFAWGTELYAEMLSLTTGWEIDISELLTTGERIFNLERLFNIREGFSKSDDTLPKRLLHEPQQQGAAVKLKEMLEEYYALRGWGRDGIPKHEKLRWLGLEKEGRL
jgi:aldehyde:ferredoxin oxidoreductase